MLKIVWWIRLIDEINKAESAGRSLRNISLTAGLGPNYVEQMRKKGKMPSADVVKKLAEALGISVTYIFTGVQMTREAEQLLALWASLTEEQKDSLLQMLRSMQPSGEPQQE